MSTFAVRVHRIGRPVEDHPNADRLSLVYINDYVCIANKLEDGSHRYREGDLVVYIPEASIVPEWLLKRMNFWREATEESTDPLTGKVIKASPAKGGLGGSQGNRVIAMKLRNIFSQGILLPVITQANTEDEFLDHYLMGEEPMDSSEPVDILNVDEGQDVTEFLGITKYEPPVPVAMAGEVCNIFGHTLKYDFENLQGIPDMFVKGEEVVATEKLHGTNCQIGWVEGLNHPELFAGGDVYVGSKGLCAQGLVMKDNDANAGNVYVRTLRKLLDEGLLENILKANHDYSAVEKVTSIHIFGEVYGKGIQDLAYDTTEPQFACFDIAINRKFVRFDLFKTFAKLLNLPIVPILYEGPYDVEVLKTYRDGKTWLGGKNIREGIVVKAANGAYHDYHGRKIGKMISPAYLLRKDGTEYT